MDKKSGHVRTAAFGEQVGQRWRPCNAWDKPALAGGCGTGTSRMRGPEIGPRRHGSLTLWRWTMLDMERAQSFLWTKTTVLGGVQVIYRLERVMFVPGSPQDTTKVVT